jgi:hypothetical protein
MKTIWKYTVSGAVTEVLMPADAQILSIQMQEARICMWALVDPERPKVSRTFRTRGTGWVIGSDETLGTHLGTVIDGPFVWHIFEVS